MSPREEMPVEDPMPTRDAAVAEMARYGIARVPTDTFHYREYRYTRLSDAVAQARRDANAALAAPK